MALGKKGQAGLEYVAIIALALVVLVPLAFFAVQRAQVNSNLAQADIAVSKIATAIEVVRAQGPGATIYLEYYLPGDASNLTIGGREVLLTMAGQSGQGQAVYRVASANLTPNSLPFVQGVYVLEVKHQASGNVSVALSTSPAASEATPRLVDYPPAYSQNTTGSPDAGSPVLFSLYWADDNGMSSFVFSFDNGNGTLYNDSARQLSGVGNWSNVTKTTNATVGSTLRWKVYANDSAGNWTASSTYSLVTATETTPPAVFLYNPQNGNSTRNTFISFNYTGIDAASQLKNSTLYGNFSGWWAANNSNASNVLNGSWHVINVSSLAENYFVWNVRVCDAYGNCGFNSTTNFTLRVDRTAPFPPTLLFPYDGSSGNRTPVFAWTDVSDPSTPVSFELQVDQSSSFATPYDLNKNVTTTSYTVQSAEQLANNKQFYWRVRAIDAAGNAGGWSFSWQYET